jgi:hypothetical protein
VAVVMAQSQILDRNALLSARNFPRHPCLCHGGSEGWIANVWDVPLGAEGLVLLFYDDCFTPRYDDVDVACRQCERKGDRENIQNNDVIITRFAFRPHIISHHYYYFFEQQQQQSGQQNNERDLRKKIGKCESDLTHTYYGFVFGGALIFARGFRDERAINGRIFVCLDMMHRWLDTCTRLNSNIALKNH